MRNLYRYLLKFRKKKFHKKLKFNTIKNTCIR